MRAWKPASRSPGSPRREAFLERTPGKIHSTYLFPAIVFLFVLQPVFATLSSTASEVLALVLAVMLVIGIWSLAPGRLWSRVGIGIFLAMLGTLGVHAVAPSVALMVAGTVWLDLLGLLCVILGVRWLFGSHRITAEGLLMSMSLFLLIGIFFATLSLGLYLVDPWSYSGLSPSGQSGEMEGLLYFSIGTLTGVAYGDILPVHPIARLLSSIEAVIGQMYMAVLVAMLVSDYAAGRSAGSAGGPPAH
jgi:hypothetical protein